jgi:hypothetical protein
MAREHKSREVSPLPESASSRLFGLRARPRNEPASSSTTFHSPLLPSTEQPDDELNTIEIDTPDPREDHDHFEDAAETPTVPAIMFPAPNNPPFSLADLQRVIQEAVATALPAAVDEALQDRGVGQNIPHSRGSSAGYVQSTLRPRQSASVPRSPSPGAATPARDSSSSSYKIRYPKYPFADNRGDVNYESWKLEIMILIEENTRELNTVEKQIRVYFRCTAGRAREIIMERMRGEDKWQSVTEVITALDEEFFDYNKETRASEEYHELKMEKSETYLHFRSEFRRLALDGKIARSRWFDDTCVKINIHLQKALISEKHRLGKDYRALDEHLQYLDRELTTTNARYKREQAANRPPTPVKATPGVLKPPGLAASYNTGSKSPKVSFKPETTQFRASSPTHSDTSSPAITSPTVQCYHCNKFGHIKTHCPELVPKQVNEIALEEMSEEELSKNS